jgi:metallo-beta-lactamase family protein
MKKKKNKENDIVVSFLGGSKDDVTGSSILISYPKNKKEHGLLMLELGLIQGNATIDKDIAYNRKMLDNISKDIVSNIEYVLLGHCHIDHVGNLSYLNSDNGFKGKILGSKKCIELSKNLIKDSLYIHNKNIEALKSQGKKTRPLYTELQMYDMFEKMESVEVGEKHRLNKQVEYKLVNSGHVVGGCMIHLWITKPNNSVVHICYTSDMGSNNNLEFQPFVKARDDIGKCNLLISEATYNDVNRSFTKKDAINEREEFKKIIKESLLENKRILLPTFSFGRCQTFMIFLYEWLKDEEWAKDIPIILDGVLLHHINETYLRILDDGDKEYFQQVMSWKNFQFNKNYDGTIAILSKRTSGVYISSSGFMVNGRVQTYLQQFLNSSKDVILVTGFCGGVGSLGWKIISSDQKTVTINKSVVFKRALIKTFRTFSSHIQYEELINLYKNTNCNKILIHHSSEDKKYEFADEVRKELRKIGKTTKVDVVDKNNNQFIL